MPVPPVASPKDRSVHGGFTLNRSGPKSWPTSALRRDVLLGTSGALSQAEVQQLKPICEVPLHRLKADQWTTWWSIR